MHSTKTYTVHADCGMSVIYRCLLKAYASVCTDPDANTFTAYYFRTSGAQVAPSIKTYITESADIL